MSAFAASSPSSGPPPSGRALVGISLCAWMPMRAVHRRLRATAIAQADTFSRLMIRLGNAFRNLTLIRLHNLQEGEQRGFVQHLREYTKDVDRYLMVENLMTAAGPLLVITGSIMIAAAQGTPFALDRTIAIPYLYLFVRLAQQLGMSAGAVGRLAYSAPDRPAAIETAIGWSLRHVTFALCRRRTYLFSGTL